MHFRHRCNPPIQLLHPREWRKSPCHWGRLASVGAMKISGRRFIHRVAYCVAVSLLMPFVSASASPLQDQGGVTPAGQNSSSTQSQPNLPDSPDSVHPQVAGNTSPFGGQQSLTAQQQDQEPVGTAAAAGVETTGVAASKPAGAAIAPAKQRRTRSFLIKVSAIVGASVAVGTVVALANASPSRPPGAR
jgi:hypothetical protein